MYWNLFKPQTLRILDSLLEGDRSLEELSILMGSSKSNLKQRYLDELERMGLVERIIVRTHIGREARFRLRPYTIVMSMDPGSGSFLFIESEERIDPDRILLHQVDINFRGDIRKLLDRIDPDLLGQMIIVLFGSVAVGKGTDKSDIDLLFLKEDWGKEEASILDSVSDISLDIVHRISPVFMRTGDFISKKTVLIEEIKKNGMILVGRMDEDGAIWHRMKRYSSITI